MDLHQKALAAYGECVKRINTVFGNATASRENEMQSGHDVESEALSSTTSGADNRVCSSGTISSSESNMGSQVTIAYPGLSSVAKSAKPLPTANDIGNLHTNTTNANANEQKHSGPRLFSLLIGINTYNESKEVSINRGGGNSTVSGSSSGLSSFPNLRGAIADAQHVHDYLTSILGVSEDRITFLRDEQATRSGIITAFEDLSKIDNDIQYGDSILIFYAGHGAQARSPLRIFDRQGCPEYTELIVPSDFNKHPADQRSMGIPDFTLAALLNAIAENKGDNITVIFDCCHSASSLRGLSVTSHDADPEFITRGGPELDFHIPDDLDEHIWRPNTRGFTSLPRLRHLGTMSYVFFSACATYELAREKYGRGCFTLALLTLLEEHGPRSLTCSEIISLLKKPDGQTPQCEGAHMNRPIFHGFTPLSQTGFFIVRTDSRSQSVLTVNAGSVNGLRKGDQLIIYKSRSEVDQKSPIGVLAVDKVDTTSSTLEPSESCSFTPPAIAVLIEQGRHLPILYITESNPNDAIRYWAIEELVNSKSVFITSDREMAHVSLSIDLKDSDGVLLKVVDRELRHLKFECSHTVKRADLVSVLKDLSHYYWHLKRASPSDSTIPLPSISILFYELKEDTSAFPTISPINEADLTKDGIVHLKLPIGVSDDALTLYGLKVINNSQCDLYPALFHFDNTTFAITQCYQHPLPSANGQTESPLKKGKFMTIGYSTVGPGAEPPFIFPLLETQSIDVGFFKLFLSEEPVDLQNITQDAVFDSETVRGMKTRPPKSVSPPLLLSRWASITIMVVQEGVSTPAPTAT